MKRFASVVTVAGGYVPTETEALGVLQAYTYAYLHDESVFSTKRQADLQQFINVVVQPAEASVGVALAVQYGVATNVSPGEIFAGYDNANTSGIAVLNGTQDGSKSDVLIAGSGAYVVTAGSGADLLIGGSGSDTLVAGSGADTLIGGDGNATLVGGTGNDTFDVNNPGGVATTVTIETIPGQTGAVEVTTDGQASALVGLGVSPAVSSDGNTITWNAPAGGYTYTFNKNTQALTITGGSLSSEGSSESIVIDNFDLSAAESGTYLGIHLNPLGLITSGSVANGDPPSSNFEGGTSQSYTIST
ncbi:MAG: calcium-binding protein, partial [Candidatus Micrarchaeaceae archaeon]